MSTPQILDGRFEVVRQLGKGGMGVVYEVVHVLTKQRAALKLLHQRFAKEPEIVERFAREASAAGRIRNPHIIGISDAGKFADGTPYLVMELLEGQPLSELLRYEGRLEIADAVGIILQACDALTAAHAANIVHRDLKPENLFVSERDGAHFIRVMDFGISKFSTDALTVTLPGVPMGTPLYMPPEQFREARDVDARADVYSLGVVLYEMLAGGVPYEAKSFAELSVEVLGGRAPRVKTYRPDVPDALDTIVMRCLAVDVNERVQSMRELKALLEPFTSHPRRPESERGSFEFKRVAPLATPYRPPALEVPPPPTLGQRLWSATSATFKGAVLVVGLLGVFVALVFVSANQQRQEVVIPPMQIALPIPPPVKGPTLQKVEPNTWSLKGMGGPIEAKLLVRNQMKKPVTFTLEGERLTCEADCTVYLPVGPLKLDGDSDTCLGASSITVAKDDVWVFNPGALSGYQLQEATFGGYMGSARKQVRIDGAVLFRVPKDVDFLFEELPESVQVETNQLGLAVPTLKRALAPRAHSGGVRCSATDGVRVTELDDHVFAAQRTDVADPPSALVWVDVPAGTERLQVDGVMVADLPKGQHQLLLSPGAQTLSLGGFTGIKANVQAGRTYLFSPGARRSFTLEERRYGDNSLPKWGASKATFRPPPFVELWSEVNFAPWPETVEGPLVSADVLRLTPNAPKTWSADTTAEFKKLEARAQKLSPELLQQHHSRIYPLEASKVDDCDLAIVRASLSEAESGTSEYVPYTRGLELCPNDPRRYELSVSSQVRTGGCKKLKELAAIDGGLPELFAPQLAACSKP